MGIAAGVSAPADTPETGAKKFIEAIRELNRRMGIPETLPCIREEDIPVMAAHADREANPLYPVPLLMDGEALAAIYRKIMKGSNEHEPQTN